MGMFARKIKIDYILIYTFIAISFTLLIIIVENFSSSYGIENYITSDNNLQIDNNYNDGNNDGKIYYKPKIISVADTNQVCNEHDLNDNFDFTYELKDGQTSPNGKWKNVYTGLGHTGVEDFNGSHVFFLKPKASNNSKETEASLTKSVLTFCDFKADFDINTVKQLRQNSPPNPWEAGWFIFRYTDTFHYYWFLIRSDGIELGKKDCDTCSDPIEGQQFLVTKNFPKIKLDKWTHWKIIMDGNHIQIFVDGIQLIDYTDDNITSQLSSGAIAMYSEDAYVRYDNMDIKIR